MVVQKGNVQVSGGVAVAGEAVIGWEGASAMVRTRLVAVGREAGGYT